VKSNCALVVLAVAAVFATSACAGEADVIDAKVRRSASNTFDFDVTVKSVDKGAGYYADAIEVLAPDGKLLGRRELLHPHEDDTGAMADNVPADRFPQPQPNAGSRQPVVIASATTPAAQAVNADERMSVVTATGQLSVPGNPAFGRVASK
jgi:hypothetical protein